MTDNTLCACGCGNMLCPFDDRGRPRKFLLGHASRSHKYKLIAEYISPTNKTCTHCLNVKSITQFYYKSYKSKTTGEKYKRYRSECIECSKQHSSSYIQENYELVYSKKKNNRVINKHEVTFHIKDRISAWRKASIVKSDLTVDYLVDLYNKQDGYCYYSGEKMVIGWVNGKINQQTMSLDKLDPNKGYVQGNVVWCSYLTNTMKQNLNESEFYILLSKILDRCGKVAKPTIVSFDHEED